jgi:hypothetical protein
VELEAGHHHCKSSLTVVLTGWLPQQPTCERAAAERIHGRMQLAAESIIEVDHESIEQREHSATAVD